MPLPNTRFSRAGGPRPGPATTESVETPACRVSLAAKTGQAPSLQSGLRVFREYLIQTFARGDYGQFRNLRNQPFHLAGLDFILGDAARLARSSIDHRR